MSLLLFDTHAHYDDEKFDGDRDTILCGLATYGISHVINVGSDIESSEKGRGLASRYGFISFAAGIHPHCAAEAPPDFEEALTRFFRGDAFTAAVALGEIGLDYHYDFSPRGRQREVFARQLALAGQLGIPVIIHDREAHADVIDILKAHSGSLHGGVFHCFSGDRRLAAQALDLGMHIAFGGALTFKKSDELADAAAYVPYDRLLIETDCPYLSPEPFRGQRNDSSRIGLVAARLAQIRNLELDETAMLTNENAKRLFSIQ